MHAVAIHFHAGHHLLHLAVHAHVHVSFLTNGFKQFLVMTLSALHERRQQQDFLARVLTHDEVDDLLVGVMHHFLARQVRVRLARTGKQQTQKIIHLGHGAHRRTRVAARRFLVDGDNGTQAGYLVHIRPLHLSDEPAGV